MVHRVPEDPDAGLRIGELSRRVSVSPELLRAWEKRYGLLSPHRTPAGYRLYSEEDEVRIRRMRQYLVRGYSAAEAARLAREEEAGQAARAPVPLDALGERLLLALDAFDDGGAHVTLDQMLATYELDVVLRDLLIPFLRRLGERWARGEVSVAQEHFASNVIGARLRGLARAWDIGPGPHAILACPAGERHDLGLLSFGLALRERGWRITYLGADTPGPTLADAVAAVEPDVVVLSAVTPEPLVRMLHDLAALSRRLHLVIAGAGASSALAERTGSELVRADPVTAAQDISVRHGLVPVS
jgi:MerR family transcriptional regulator, light-induced transcriptional regulator